MNWSLICKTRGAPKKCQPIHVGIYCSGYCEACEHIWGRLWGVHHVSNSVGGSIIWKFSQVYVTSRKAVSQSVVWFQNRGGNGAKAEGNGDGHCSALVADAKSQFQYRQDSMSSDVCRKISTTTNQCIVMYGMLSLRSLLETWVVALPISHMVFLLSFMVH